MVRTISMAVVCSLCLIGCGGDDGDATADAAAADADTAAPDVLSTSPAADATDVPIDTLVAVTFSEDIDSSTLNMSSFTLEDSAGNPVSGTVSASGAAGTFTADSPLSYGVSYTAAITTAVTDGSGNALEAAVLWSFTIHAQAWGGAELIETDDAGDAAYAEAEFDASGNAVAVWVQSNGTRNNVWANRYAAGTGWGTAELIETDDAGGATRADVAVDAAGNAVAVWYQSDGTRYNIWANRYVAGTGWGTAELIETDDTDNANAPKVEMDGAGNAIAVWYQWDGTRYNIWANRYVAGTGWGTTQLIESDNAGGVGPPHVAMDPSGNAVAVWQQDDGTRYNIWANRYATGTGWGPAELVETNDTGAAQYPHVAVDAAGNALAVWQQNDGTRDSIWANRLE